MKIVSKFELDFFPRQILYQSENILSDIEILHSSNIFMHSYICSICTCLLGNKGLKQKHMLHEY